MAGFGIGAQSTPKPKGDGGANSSKIQLLQGQAPLYKGDHRVPTVDTVEPMVVTVIGPPGIGKTHFAMTFPYPYLVDTEMKGEKIWRKFWGGKVHSFRISGEGVVEEYQWDPSVVTPDHSNLYHAEDWGDVASAYEHAIDDQAIQTLVFDSETDLREYAELWTLEETGKNTLYGGKDAGTKPFALVYGKLKYILLNGKKGGKHLVYTQKEKPVYRNDKATGEMTADGYNKQHFYSGYVIHLQLGIRTKAGEHIYPKHVFGKVIKAENMKPGFYPPYLVDCTFRGLVEELVRGEEWVRSEEDFIRDVIGPKMKVQGIER